MGVFVERSGLISSRFLGEVENGSWNLGRLKGLPNPNAYRLWVDHWKKTVDARSAVFGGEEIRSPGGMFTLIPGGELHDTGSDAPSEICAFLYSTLVSAAGLAGALTDQEPDGEVLREAVADAFRAQNLFTAGSLPHPIIFNAEVKGAEHYHRIAFYQEANHEAWAMEPVDFTRFQKNLARDHAAYARYVFDDLHARSMSNGLKINNIAIIRLTPEDQEHPAVSTGLEMLTNRCTLVNWLEPRAREDFIDERASFAHSS